MGGYGSASCVQWNARICSRRLSSMIETTDEIPKRATFSGVSMVYARPITGIWKVWRSVTRDSLCAIAHLRINLPLLTTLPGPRKRAPEPWSGEEEVHDGPTIGPDTISVTHRRSDRSEGVREGLASLREKRLGDSASFGFPLRSYIPL